MQEKKAKKIHDAASIARLHQHDVRAKQARACDAERTGFLTPIFILVTSPACWRVITHASNYLGTDGQLIVQGRLACSNPSLTASLTAVFPSVDKSQIALWYFSWSIFFHQSGTFFKKIRHIIIAKGKWFRFAKKKDHVCLDGMLFPETFPGYEWQKVNLLFPWRIRDDNWNCGRMR